MHVIISIDDQENGEISVKTLVHPALVGDDAPARTPAVELGSFLQAAIDAWQTTRDMALPDALAYVRSMSIKPTMN